MIYLIQYIILHHPLLAISFAASKVNAFISANCCIIFVSISILVYLNNSTIYDAIFYVDTSEVFASLASKAAYHQYFMGVLALNAEWAWSDVLEVSIDKFIDVKFCIFHYLAVYNLRFL